MVEDEGDCVRIEAGIERIQHGARHRHAEMGVVHGGDVGRHHGDRVVLADPAPLQRARQATGADISVRPGDPPIAMLDRQPIGIDGGGAAEKAERAQRHEIGVVLVEIGVVGARRHYPVLAGVSANAVQRKCAT